MKSLYSNDELIGLTSDITAAKLVKMTARASHPSPSMDGRKDGLKVGLSVVTVTVTPSNISLQSNIILMERRNDLRGMDQDG
jgi:hypothetical protein